VRTLEKKIGGRSLPKSGGHHEWRGQLLFPMNIRKRRKKAQQRLRGKGSSNIGFGRDRRNFLKIRRGQFWFRLIGGGWGGGNKSKLRGEEKTNGRPSEKRTRDNDHRTSQLFDYPGKFVEGEKNSYRETSIVKSQRLVGACCGLFWGRSRERRLYSKKRG